MSQHDLFSKILRDHGYSSTKVRRFVFETLLGSEPQTMHQLIEAGKDTVDRVSIYRTVDLYEKLGIVQRITVGWKYKIELSDIFMDHHHHMTCLGCGKVIAIKENDALENAIRQACQTNGFLLTQHQLEMQGLCRQCQQLQ